MADFKAALAYVIENEGGYGWDPNDSGGPTKWGITQEDLSKYLGREASPEEVKDMSMDVCEAIYKKAYWDPLSLDGSTRQAIATAVFDTCVLNGLLTGARFAQQAANAAGAEPALKIDGGIGPITLGVFDKINAKVFLQALALLLAKHYQTIVDLNPTDKEFLNGWKNRAKRLLTLA